MRKKFLRKLAAALAAVMVITNLSPLTAVVSAEESATTYETTYYLSQLQVVGGWGNSVNADPAGTAIHFNQQYSEVDYGIPAEVVESGLVSVNVDASSSEHLALKFLDNNGNQQAVDYSKTVLVADRSKENVRLGIMNKDEGEWDITVGAVTFVTASPIGETAKVPSSTTYTLDELGGIGGYNYTREGNVFTFEDEYKLASFAIPEEVLAAKLISVQVVAEDFGNFAIKVLSTADDELAVEYGKTTIAVPGDKLDTAKRVGLMSLGKGVSSVSASGFVFVTEDSVSKAVTPSEPTEPETPSEVMEKTYSIDELTVAGGYGCEVKAIDGGSEFAFNGQWQEMMYAIPEEIMKAGVKKVSITVVSGDASNISLKERNASGDELNAAYGSTEMLITNTETVSIGIMNGADVAASYVISGVTFTTKYPIGSEVPEEPEQSEERLYFDRTYFIDELVNKGGYGCTVREEADATYFDYASIYQEMRYAIPEDVLSAGLKGITVEVSNGNTGALSLKVQDEEFKQLAVTYGSDSITYVGDDAKNFALMNREEGAQTIAIASVTFHTEKGFPLPKERTFSFDELTVTGGYGYTADINSNNTVIDYNGQYQEVRFAIPAEVLAAGFKSFTVNVTNGNTGALSLKVQDDGFNQLAVAYGGDSISYTGEAAKNFALMNLTAGADTIAASGVTFYAENGIEGAEIRKRVNVPKNENERTLEFTASDIKLVHRVSDEHPDPDPVKGNTVTFTHLWDEYYFDFGEEIYMEKIKSVSIKVKNQGNTVSYKLYDKTDKELQPYYGKNGDTVLNTTNDGVASRFAVMAHVQDDAAYPFDITIDSITVKIDTTAVEIVDKEVEYDILNLRDVVEATLGEDFIFGTACSYDEFGDAKDMALATKHFNAITLGNELKPDSILGKGYENIQKVSFNGVTFDFPTLSYSNPESRLDFILKWNEEHPDRQIKVRGHVLVWHSQMPTWFFREGYSSNGAYVSKEIMDLRLEYYIKSVCEHFTAEGSKYKGMFYGWDVVNEAVSDGGGYRKYFNEAITDWWAIYGSNEFINKAFVYANRYMDPEVELYYNDYNDTQANKIDSIEQLLRDVKATPGARIDGFGMQAHYDVNSPSAAVFMNAARRYAAIVPSVQVTELDFKGSTGPTDEKLAKRYEDIYNSIRRLREDGVNVTGMTIWGVTDKHSWLQSQNNVGGGSTSNAKQYPLLFDNNYKAKNSFWAIANAGELMPEIKSVSLIKSADNNFTAGKEHTFKKGNDVVTFIPEWNDKGITVKVTVPDTTKSSDDKVVLYVNDGTETRKVTAVRTNKVSKPEGYTVVLSAEVATEIIMSNKVKLDIVVTDDGKQYAFNDTRLKQEADTTYYATTRVNASDVVGKGTVKVDGNGNDKAWKDATELILAVNNGSSAEAKAKVLWDEKYLYVLVNVKDADLDDKASNAWEQDSIEVFIDENNNKSVSYEDDDKQYRINFNNVLSFNGTKCIAENVISAATVTEDGYVVEAAFKWTDITPKKGMNIGFDVQLNDASNGARVGTINWADETGNGYASPAVFGTILLNNKEEVKPVPSNNGKKTSTVTEVIVPAEESEEPEAPVVETPGRVAEETEEAEAIEETVEEAVETTEEITVPEVVEEAAETVEEVIAEEETPLAPAITTAAPETGMGIMLKLAIAAAVVAIGGIATCLYVFKFKK